MIAREVVTAALEAHLPNTYRLLPYGRSLDGADRITVMVRVDEVTPAPPHRDYTFTLIVVCPASTAGYADDLLDAALEQTLAALDLSELVWTSARRGVLEGAELPCYEITCPTPIAYSHPEPPEEEEEEVP